MVSKITKIWLGLMFLTVVLIGIHYQTISSSTEIKISNPIPNSNSQKVTEAPSFQELFEAQKEASENTKTTGLSNLKNDKLLFKIKNP